RLDTTNTVKRIGSVLTRIDLDHTQILGDTLDKIAIEKAPILQPKIFNVIARQETQAQNVLSKYTKDFDAVDVEGKDFFHSGTFDTFTFENENFYLSPTTLGLLGQHQSTNAALAIQAASHVLGLEGKTLESEKTKNALSQTKLLGRMETWKKKNQTVIVDVAHNPAGIDALISYLYTKDPKQRYHIIFGCSNDKNASNMIQALGKIAHNIVCTSFAHPRSWKANSYAETWFENVETAFCATWESATQPVIAAGSIFYIAELIPILQKYGFEKV
ncbi:MAG: hypothetical protein KDD46_05140, partial [Bdellovibrionales bacterium]|nr:hypothetical protein [Bdellovibrionales bacterium]